MTEVADYFNKFYTIVIKDIVTDPLINSQWAYFLTMFKNSPLDKSRIDLYLDILNKEHKKKKESKCLEKTTSSVLSAENREKTAENVEIHLPTSQLKFQKRWSENWRGTLVAFDKNRQEGTKVRKLSSIDDPLGSCPMFSTQTKPLNNKREESLGVPRSSSPNVARYMTSLALTLKHTESLQQKQKEKHRKLCQISGKIAKMFAVGAKLRA